MTEPEITVRRIEMLVEQYVTTRKRRHNCISTDAAVKAIEQIISTVPLADRELDDLIATAAVANGLAVSFDRLRRTPTSSP